MPVSAVKKYRWRKRMLPTLLVAYLLVATTQSPEIFPFFSWNLFARISSRAKRFHVVIQSVDGKPVEPLDLMLDRNELSKFGIHARLNRESLKLLKAAGNCLELLKERAACESHLQEMERVLFSRNESATYQIVRSRYNPYKLLIRGEERDRVTLASLTYGGPTR